MYNLIYLLEVNNQLIKTHLISIMGTLGIHRRLLMLWQQLVERQEVLWSDVDKTFYAICFSIAFDVVFLCKGRFSVWLQGHPPELSHSVKLFLKDAKSYGFEIIRFKSAKIDIILLCEHATLWEAWSIHPSICPSVGPSVHWSVHNVQVEKWKMSVLDALLGMCVCRWGHGV